MASWGKGLSSLYSLPRVQVRLLGPGVKRLPNSKDRVLAKFAEGHEIFSGLVGEVLWVIHCPVVVLPRNGGSEPRCSSLPSHWVSDEGILLRGVTTCTEVLEVHLGYILPSLNHSQWSSRNNAEFQLVEKTVAKI